MKNRPTVRLGPSAYLGPSTKCPRPSTKSCANIENRSNVLTGTHSTYSRARLRRDAGVTARLSVHEGRYTTTTSSRMTRARSRKPIAWVSAMVLCSMESDVDCRPPTFRFARSNISPSGRITNTPTCVNPAVGRSRTRDWVSGSKDESEDQRESAALEMGPVNPDSTARRPARVHRGSGRPLPSKFEE